MPQEPVLGRAPLDCCLIVVSKSMFDPPFISTSATDCSVFGIGIIILPLYYYCTTPMSPPSSAKQRHTIPEMSITYSVSRRTCTARKTCSTRPDRSGGIPLCPSRARTSASGTPPDSCSDTEGTSTPFGSPFYPVVFGSVYRHIKGRKRSTTIVR